MRIQHLPAFTAILAVGMLHQEAAAAISISKVTLGENRFHFKISGTLPNTLPSGSRNVLFFVNPNPSTDPGFVIGPSKFPQAWTGMGTAPLTSQSGAFRTGIPSLGDYFYFVRPNNFSAGEYFSDEITAIWNIPGFSTTDPASPMFDPSAFNGLNIYWGADSDLPFGPSIQPSTITSGIFLTSVPEPSCSLLLSVGSLVLWRRARKRRVAPTVPDADGLFQSS